MNEKLESLKRIIIECFPEKYLSQHSFWNESSLEGLQVKNFFEGKSWKEITLESLRAGYKGDTSACLSFMSVDGAQYYLPAFLSIVIEDYFGADMISDSLIYEFTDLLPADSSSVAKVLQRLIWN